MGLSSSVFQANNLNDLTESLQISHNGNKSLLNAASELNFTNKEPIWMQSQFIRVPIIHVGFQRPQLFAFNQEFPVDKRQR